MHRSTRVGFFISPLFAVAACAHAASFDQTVRAPRAASGAELKQKAAEFFGGADVATQMSQFLRDERAQARWIEFRWQFSRAVDAHKSLRSLVAFGVSATETGYRIDETAFPQWVPLSERIADMLQPPALDGALERLRTRGFRAEDLDVVRKYVSTHDLARATLDETETLARSFEARVQASRASKQLVADGDIESFMYQRRRNVMNAVRGWTLDLLATLDPQRQRILESCALEQEYMASGVPDDHPANVKAHRQEFESGEYVRTLEMEKARMQQ